MKATLDAATAAAITKAAAVARSTDPARPHMCAVRVVVDPAGTVELSATDGYRAHIVTGPAHVGACPGDVLADGAGFAAAVRDAAKAAKAAGKGYRGAPGTGPGVEIELDDDGRAVNVRGVFAGAPVAVFAVPVRNAVFPDLAAIIPAGENVEPGAGFSGAYMGDMFAAAAVVAGDLSPVILDTVTRSKPAKVHAANADTGAAFVGILMPQRV